MRFGQRFWRVGGIGLAVFLFPLWACAPEEEPVEIEGLLHEGAVTEITHAYPEFAVTLVAEGQGNVAVTFGEGAIRVDGIDEDGARERMARYVVECLENPNKAEEDRAARETYEASPPTERLAALLGRIRSQHPNFDYERVGLGEGNVDAEYGDNSLLITGVSDDIGKEEWAHAIIQIQKEIDAAGGEDDERG